MIEWLLSGLVRVITWAWASAMALYYLAGALVVLGGFVIFLASVIHHFWKRSQETRPVVVAHEQPRVTVHVDNLNLRLEMTEPQLRRLLEEHDIQALPPGEAEESD